MKRALLFAALLTSSAALGHAGHDHAPRVIELPSRPEIRTDQQAREEAEAGCLKLAHRRGAISVRVTYSGESVTVKCPAKAAISVTATIRF